jgi:hypothetical protein
MGYGDPHGSIRLRDGTGPHPQRIYNARVDTIAEHRGIVLSMGTSLIAAFAHVIRGVDGRIAELRQTTDTNEWVAGLQDPVPTTMAGQGRNWARRCPGKVARVP